MSKRFWIWCTFLGVPITIAGIVLTAVITEATGVPCCCDTGAVAAPASAFAGTDPEFEGDEGWCSSDPRVLFGVVPLFAGMGMVGVGIWRWIVTSQLERDQAR